LAALAAIAISLLRMVHQLLDRAGHASRLKPQLVYLTG